MAKCNFCGNQISQGTGILYIRNDGRMLNFCSSKCKKNLIKLGRNPVKFKWTKFYKKGKE